ncbi:TPA: hypothetical protein ACNUUR_001125 [Aeromonas salmonicida]
MSFSLVCKSWRDLGSKRWRV